MKKEKLKLNDLRVKSFLMLLNKESQDTINGAAANNNSAITCMTVCNICPNPTDSAKCSAACPNITAGCTVPPACPPQITVPVGCPQTA